VRKNGLHLDEYRRVHPTMGSSEVGSLYGFFVVPYGRSELRVISSGEHHPGKDNLGAWEHVSVSLHNRCPGWEEMCFIKDLFWDDSECVVQFHPAKADYINAMPYCLHLWKPKKPIELPPSIALAPKVPEEQKRKAKRSAFMTTVAREIRETGKWA
jgi:hypothetical protein